jgi:membrane fusion protein, multidrug efflux system
MKVGRVLATLLVLGAAGGGYYYWSKPPGDAASPTPSARPGGRRGGGEGPVAVLVSPVQTRTMPVYREGIGNIQAYALVTVRSQIDGLLTSVEFREGQTVTRGQVLARIDPRIWQAQLDQALAKKAQDEANLANARVDFARYQQLAAANAGPKQQADQQRAVVAQLEAQVRSDEAAIDNARAYLAYTTITSPLDGRAGLRQVDPGNIIRAGDAAGLVTIAQIQPIAATFALPQRDLAATAAALAGGAVPVEALDADGRTVIATGQLEVIDNQVDITTGTVKLKAVFPNTDQKLWPGQFVTVRVRIAELKEARVVPTPAIRRGPQGTFVYVLAEGEKAMVRPVTVTQQDEQVAVIGQGVAAGERIVTAGFARLSDGKEVTVTPDGEAKPAAVPPEGAARQRGQSGQPGNGERRRNTPNAPPGAAPAISAPARPAP